MYVCISFYVEKSQILADCRIWDPWRKVCSGHNLSFKLIAMWLALKELTILKLLVLLCQILSLDSPSTTNLVAGAEGLGLMGRPVGDG